MAAKRKADLTDPRHFHLLRLGLALLLLTTAHPGQAEAEQRTDRLAVRSLFELRNEGLVRQNWDISCGAAAVATVLTYQLGAPVTEREAALGMLRDTDIKLVRARLGFSLLDLKRFAASRGFTAAGYGNLTFDELRAMAPAIVPIRIRKFGHFVVLRGVRGDRVLVADPAFGNRTMTLPAFARAWTSGIGFVVTRSGDPKPENRLGAPAHLFLAPTGSALRAVVPTFRSRGQL